MSDTDHIYSDHDIAIEDHRGDLIAAMNTAMAALAKAGGALAVLMSNQFYDVEFVESTIGGDVAAFLNDSLRYARAAYSLTRDVTDLS